MIIRKNIVRSLIQASLALATMSLLSGCIVVASASNADVQIIKNIVGTIISIDLIN